MFKGKLIIRIGCQVSGIGCQVSGVISHLSSLAPRLKSLVSSPYSLAPIPDTRSPTPDTRYSLITIDSQENCFFKTGSCDLIPVKYPSEKIENKPKEMLSILGSATQPA